MKQESNDVRSDVLAAVARSVGQLKSLKELATGYGPAQYLLGRGRPRGVSRVEGGVPEEWARLSYGEEEEELSYEVSSSPVGAYCSF